MRKIFTLMFLVCSAMPVILTAQSKQKPYVFKQSQIADYPGGIYAVWDSATKKYNWFSPLQGNLKPPVSKQNNAAVFYDKQSTTSSVFHFVKDINAVTNSNAGNYQPQFYHQHYAVLNGIAYFSADDGIHGNELWRSDGSNAGSYIVKDIEPGNASSSVTNITAASGKIYFTATTSANGSQAWISDGTSAGTHILKNISGGGMPQMYTVANSRTFFFIDRTQLWVTNGTDAGTKQINISGDNSNFSQPVAVGNKLFFTSYSYNYGKQLWRSDGTDSGTFVIKQEYGYYGAQQLTAYQGKLYFSDDDNNFNYTRTVWVSDGTTNGTIQAVNGYNISIPAYDNINQGYPDIPFTIYNNTLYFPAYDNYSYTGLELYKFNPNNADGILLVKDITPGYESTNFQPYEITNYKNGVAFKVINYDGSASLWTTKGNDADTKQVMVFPTVDSNNFSNLYNASGTLYFEAYSANNGYELWKSNGTTGGTQLVNDIYSGVTSSYPYFTTSLGSNILFTANNIAAGKELWKTDGTTAGTQLAKDINQSSSLSSIVTNNFTAASNGVVFAATDMINGNEPFYSDGTSSNTNLIKDILPGASGSNPYAMKTINNYVYFLVQDDENDLYAIYRFKAANKTLVKLFEAPAGYAIQNNYAVADNGLVFFQLYNSYSYANEIWRTDGTAAGSFLLKASYYYYYNNANEIIAIGNTAFFPYNDYYYGNELYKSDGTVKGTKIVNDLYAGSNGSNPYSLINYNGILYFGAQDEDGYTYLWKSDGTFGGTKKVAQIVPAMVQPGDKDQSRVYCISKGLLYINASNYSSGQSSLWISNGTTANLVKNINPFYSANINNLTNVNGMVYFSADDGANGNELWESNGTLIGTILIKNITPGTGSSNIYNFCSVSNQLYFVNDGALWTSAGIGKKTSAVMDAALQNVSSVNNLTASGSKLFFSGFTYNYGTELYEGDVTTQANVSNDQQNIIAKGLSNNLSAVISPNPVKDVATLHLSNGRNADIIVSDNTGKIIWQQSNVNKTQLQIPMQQFATGLYYIKISCSNGTQTLKLIKQQ